MGVGEDFKEFCNALSISQDTRSSISSRYESITKRLNLDFWNIDSKTSHSFYVGSYGRHTAINGFSDLDMIFELPTRLYQQYDNYLYNGQSSLLQAVKASLQKTYPDTDIGGDGQVVVINFTDKITFEIVPGFLCDDDTYRYPDSNNGGSWKQTNPKPEIKAVSDADILYNYNLKRLCKMARQWKNYCNVPMGGLLIDTLAYNFIKNWEYKNNSYVYYDWMSRDFFKHLANQNKEQQYWLAIGSNQYIYRKGLFENKANQAYVLALEAIDYQSNNQSYSAKQKWRKIYGTKYPS